MPHGCISPSESPQESIKVLYIEDDLGVARSMLRILRQNGYEVFGASTRDEAKHHTGVHGLRPDIILTDFHLGPEAGTADVIVAEIVALMQFKPPIILLTGTQSLQLDKVTSFADRILTKPVDIDVLLLEIEDLLRLSPRFNDTFTRRIAAP